MLLSPQPEILCPRATIIPDYTGIFRPIFTLICGGERLNRESDFLGKFKSEEPKITRDMPS
jgi:hypothetical protein